MNKINFVTSNSEKLLIAQTVAENYGVEIMQVVFDIDEIQGENPELIISHKAKEAFKMLGKPVVVSDDSWDIPALKGFPGPYMKSINHWFSSEDFLRLMNGVSDRTIYIHQYLAFTDGKSVTIFSNDISGKVIHEARGKNSRSPNMAVTVLDSDNGKTIAEVFEQGHEAVMSRYKNRRDAWHEFIEWYKSV